MERNGEKELFTAPDRIPKADTAVLSLIAEDTATRPLRFDDNGADARTDQGRETLAILVQESEGGRDQEARRDVAETNAPATPDKGQLVNPVQTDSKDASPRAPIIPQQTATAQASTTEDLDQNLGSQVSSVPQHITPMRPVGVPPIELPTQLEHVSIKVKASESNLTGKS